ncbi:MAG TPA: hypothetical protein VG897_15540 [Terriglobales bacterium]|nr:hypothetical protein [Terriglobales bacterium]
MDVATDPIPGKSLQANLLEFLKASWADRRIRLLVGVLGIAMAAAWYWFAAASATLTIAGHHAFRRAEVSIWVDGDLRTTSEITGSARKRFGVLQKVEGNFSRSLRVSPGNHVVKVRFHSLTDNSEITRQCKVSAEARSESTVYVNADRGVVSLSFAGSPARPQPDSEPSSSYAKTLQSIFMAIAGSALSATVGFVVQDFLKSRKAVIHQPVSSDSQPSSAISS